MSTVFSRVREDFKSKDNIRTELVSFVVSVFAFLSHICFLLLFAFLDVKEMFYFNIVSVTFFGILFFTFKKESYLTRYILCTVEVILHQVAAVYYIGVDSSFHYYLLLMALIGSLALENHKKSSVIFAVLCSLVFCGIEIFMSDMVPVYTIPKYSLKLIKAVNIILSLFVIVAIEYTFSVTVNKAEKAAQKQFERANNLLTNILPSHIINRINKNGMGETLSDYYPSVSIIVLDIVNFTDYSSQLEANALVTILDTLFSSFDSILSDYHIEKIKSHGDTYIAASGMPHTQKETYSNVAKYALHITKILEDFNKEHESNFQLRIGIHCGPVIAGVIGKKKFTYDLWGSTATFAYRMKTTDIPGRIQVSKEMYEKLYEEFDFDERAPIPIKNYGMRTNYFLIGLKN